VRRLVVALAVAALAVGALPADGAPGSSATAAKKNKRKRCHVRKRGHRRMRVCRHKPKPKRPSGGTAPGTGPVIPAAPGEPGGGAGGSGGSAPAGSGGSGGDGAGTPDAGGPGTGGGGGGPPLLPSRVGVDEREYSVVPSYTTVAAGDLEFDPVNHGEDAHDFSIRNSGGQITSVPLASGESTVVNVNLPAGTYTLYCSLPGHEGLGMKATLTVQ
jgi:plastocyanin